MQPINIINGAVRAIHQNITNSGVYSKETVREDSFEMAQNSVAKPANAHVRKSPVTRNRQSEVFSLKHAGIAVLAALAGAKPALASADPMLAPLWLTTANQSIALELQAPQAVTVMNTTTTAPTMQLNRSETFQAFQGVGGALTESAAVVLSGLPQNQRDNALTLLFDPKRGIGLTQVRYPAGPSDFSLDANTTYLDKQGGTFSIDIDMAHRVPILKQILSLNPSVRIISAPWTPPAWMKSSQSTCGGHLQSSHYGDFADYLVNFVQAYSAMGIHIGAITPQNEPLANSKDYPSTLWDGVQEGQFIEENLGPAFASANVNTEIWGYDHNYNNVTFPSQVLSDASQYVNNIAFHCYAGDPSALPKFISRHPGVDVHLTECSGGTWVGGNYSGQAFAAINALANGAPTALLWNIALTDTGGPTFSGDTTSRGIMAVSGKSFTRSPQFEVLGHISKFIQPGAVRLGLDNSLDETVYATAFRNPDDTVAVVAFNSGDDKHVTVQDDAHTYGFDVPSMGMTTLGIGFDSTQFVITAGVGALRAHAWSAPMVAALVAVWVNT